MPKKKTTKARAKASSVRVKRSDTSSRGIIARRFGRFMLPLVISCGLLGALMFLGVMGFQTATANDKNDKAFPFVLYGWDESKTEKAGPDNLARLKLYRKMFDEWKQFDLASRVKDVNLSNVRAPAATIEDSGRTIAVSLAKD